MVMWYEGERKQNRKMRGEGVLLNVLLGSEAFFPALALSFFLSGLGKSQATKSERRCSPGARKEGIWDALIHEPSSTSFLILAP